jgi:hypothetical protein
MPRVNSDLNDCVNVVAASPYGLAARREEEIFSALEKVYRLPKSRCVERRRRDSGIELRSYYVAQFVIIYAYFEPNAVMQDGVVSIRAIRHRRVRDAFRGVRDHTVAY